MRAPPHLARSLASAFLSGEWHLRVLLARGDETLGTGGLWLRAIAFDVLQTFREPPRDDVHALARFIARHQAFRAAWWRGLLPTHAVREWVLAPPVARESPWPAPAFAHEGDLAEWLGVTREELSWFADRKSLCPDAKSASLGHYTHHWVERGAVVPRLLEAPKSRLKALQRRVLEGVLGCIPAHDAAHGFVRGRSVRSHAMIHASQPVVARFDLVTFFTSVTAPRAYGVFHALGYPRSVVASLLGLCTTTTPTRVLAQAPRPTPFTAQVSGDRFHHLRRLATRHLPQGSPTSTALANLAAYGLDVRLSALATARGWRYSRYADDLVFSGDIPSGGALSEVVRAIAADEGFRVNDRKTRVMRSCKRQEVTGVVVNAGPNLPRDEFDRLKAMFHRARTQGPSSLGENSEVRAQLLGQLSWVRSLSVSKARRLERDFAAIAW